MYMYIYIVRECIVYIKNAQVCVNMFIWNAIMYMYVRNF